MFLPLLLGADRVRGILSRHLELGFQRRGLPPLMTAWFLAGWAAVSPSPTAHLPYSGHGFFPYLRRPPTHCFLTAGASVGLHRRAPPGLVMAAVVRAQAGLMLGQDGGEVTLPLSLSTPTAPTSVPATDLPFSDLRRSATEQQQQQQSRGRTSPRTAAPSPQSSMDSVSSGRETTSSPSPSPPQRV